MLENSRVLPVRREPFEKVIPFDIAVVVGSRNVRWVQVDQVVLVGIEIEHVAPDCSIASPVVERDPVVGGNLLDESEGFVVNGTKGPLKDGEIERAATWAAELAGELKE